MNFSIKYEEIGAVFLIETEGDFNFDEFRTLNEQLFAEKNWKPGTKCIFDHRKTNFHAISNEDLERVAKYHIKNNDKIGNGKTALVMKDLGNYGIARMYEGNTEYRVDTKFMAFTDINKAKEWIMT